MTDELVIRPEPLELVFDTKELAIEVGDTLVELQLDQATTLEIDSTALEVLALEAAPAWVWNTKVTVSATPPSAPKVGDVWIVRT